MIRRPPRSTRTDTPFPYTTLFRAAGAAAVGVFAARFAAGCGAGADRYGQGQRRIARRGAPALAGKWLISKKFWTVRVRNGRVASAAGACRSTHFQAWVVAFRSEERRVGDEWVSTCRTQG